MSPSQKARGDYFLRSARVIAKECLVSQADGAHDRVVRKTHEAVEMYLKGKLIEKGVEPAKTHDLKGLAAVLGGLSSVTPEQLDALTAERIPAFYGGSDLIPDEHYTQEDSDNCISILRAVGLLS